MAWRLVWVLVIGVAVSLFYAGSRPDWTDSILAVPTNVLNWTSATLNQSWQDRLLSIICAAGVFVYFYSRFNDWPRVGQTPKLFPEHQPRFFTTWMRYSAWALFYGAVLAILFLAMVYAPDFFSKILALLDVLFPENPLMQRLGPDILSPTGGSGDHVWFVGSALVATVFFAKSEFEGKLREFFQTRAMIPYEAESIFGQLERNFFKLPLAIDSLDEDDRIEIETRIGEFLRDSRADRRMPTYYEFELVVEREQELQRRLELLPRVEFMLWRLQQQEFSAEIDAELYRHEGKLKQVEESIKPLRETAILVNEQLMAALEGLRTIEEAANQFITEPHDEGDLIKEKLGAYSRVLERTGLGNSSSPISSIPVSRLDDVAEALEHELDDMGKRLAALNGTAFDALQHMAPSSRAASFKAVATILEALMELRGQLQSLLEGLSPLCGFGLKSIDDSLSERQPLVRLAAGQVLGFAICIALAASRQPNWKFFASLGLWPRLGTVRFRAERAISFVVGQVIFYIALVMAIRYALDADYVVQFRDTFFPNSNLLLEYIGILQQQDGTRSSPIDVPVWITIGSWFIVGPLFHGCYHGSALASLRDRRFESSRPQDFRWSECISSYIMIWSIAIVGLFVITYVVDMPNTFSGASPFTIVPAVWGVVVAAATMRVSLDLEPIKFWRDTFWALLGTIGGLWLVMEWTTAGDLSAFDYLMWVIVFLLGTVLCLFLMITIRVSFHRSGDLKLLQD